MVLILFSRIGLENKINTMIYQMFEHFTFPHPIIGQIHFIFL